MLHRVLAPLILSALFLLPSVGNAERSSAPVGLSLAVQPGLVDVGGEAVFTLNAKKWGGPVSVTLTFLSPHHGFTGMMPWRPACNCFQLAVILARRIHPLETARAVVHVRAGKTVEQTASMFQIRGLSNDGHDFAPGGAVVMNAWVSDPHPSTNQYEHYCVFTHTVDGLGVAGYRARFVVKEPEGTKTYGAGSTDRTGVACTSKSIGNLPSGTAVRVTAYAGPLKESLKFSTQG